MGSENCLFSWFHFHYFPSSCTHNLVHLCLMNLSRTLFYLIKTIKSKKRLIDYFLCIKWNITQMISIVIFHPTLLSVLSSALGLIACIGLLFGLPLLMNKFTFVSFWSCISTYGKSKSWINFEALVQQVIVILNHLKHRTN